jgi:hypothetical protein
VLSLLLSFILLQTSVGSIEGRLSLPDGKPAIGVRVALAPADSSDVPTLLNISATDESGRFNLSEIPPGQYYVLAGLADSPTYYPGAERAKAALVAVRAGAKTENITFSLSKGVSFKVSGRVIDYIAGRALPKVSLWRAFYTDRFDVAADAQGTFEFSNVRPGNYVLSIGLPSRGGVTTRSIVIGDQDVANIELRILPQIEVSGRIVVRPTAPLPEGFVVQGDLPSTFSGTEEERFADNVQRSGGIRTIVPNADGSFKLVLAAGEHQIAVKRLPAEYEVESIRRGSQDLLRETLKVDTTPLSNLEIVIARRGASAPLR